MKLGEHTLIGLTCYGGLYNFTDHKQLCIAVVASVLIDIDHYFEYVRRTGELSPISMFGWYDQLAISDDAKNGQYYFGICPFHTIEFFVLCTVFLL